MQNVLNYLVDSEMRKLKSGRSQFFQHRFDHASNLYWKDLKGHFSCVNSIEFSNAESQHMISAGDDMRILLWNINNDILSADNSTGTKSQPYVFRTQHNSNIFTLAWDNENKNILSGANDHQVIVHDARTGQVVDVFLHQAAVYCLSVNPKQSHVFATASESGHVSLFDMRLSSSSDPIVLASSASRGGTSNSFFSTSNVSSAFHSCCFNPVESNIIAVANEVSGISLIDIRMKSVLLRYRQASVHATGADPLPAAGVSRGGSRENRLDPPLGVSTKSADFKQNAMNVRFNQYGTQLAALRHRLRPVLYLLNEPTPVYTFEDESFSNSCTLKSACFAGDQDQYFVSGSDDFNVYVWKIPATFYTGLDDDDSAAPARPKTTKLISGAHLKLASHRSIVNQVRYNYNYHLLASSGVEKLVKIWTPFRPPGCTNGGLLGREDEYVPRRKLYTTRDLFELRWDASDSSSTGGSSSLNLTNSSLSSSSSNSSSTFYEESDESDSSTLSGGGPSSTDPLDVAAANYEPVIRNVMAANPETSESLEEDRVMIAFFDSLVRRQQAKNREASRSFLRKLKRRNRRHRSGVLDDDDTDDDLSIIDEDPAENDDDLSTSSDSSSSLTTSTSSSTSLTESSSGSFTFSSSSEDSTPAAGKKKSRKTRVSSSSDGDADSSSLSSFDTGGSSTSLSDLNEEPTDLSLVSADSQASKNLARNKQSKSNIALRNRIRNLRHRRSLNLTQEDDYLNVLDSLQVQRAAGESSPPPPSAARGDEASHLPAPARTTEDPDTKIFSDLDTTTSDRNSPDTFTEAPSQQPGTSRNLVLKGLNEKKRKIEMNRDDDEADSEPSSTSPPPELAKSSSAGSLFRKSKKKRQNDDKSSD